MEKALFPLKYMNQTQGVNGSYSHQGTYAIDYGNRGVKEKLYAPFTGIIRKIYTTSGNGVWLESVDKVLYADGTIDYMTVLTMHDDDVSDLKVGQIIKQGEVYYHQGKAGNATGIHVHLEVGKGKYTGTGWYKNSNDIWMINNAIHPCDALFLTEDIDIVDDGGYNWRKLVGTPVGRDVNKNQIEVLINNLNCRSNPYGKILGYINAGIYNIISKEVNGEYEWYQVENNRWIAHSDDWSKLYEINNQNDDEKINELKNKITQLEEENNNLKKKINLLEQNNETKFTFLCKKTSTYAIKLYKNEILEIKDYKET